MLSVRATCLAILLCLVLLPAGRASAQTTQPAAQTLLVTFGSGQEVYEKFSHNAIWIHDAAAPREYRDVAFNYGLFSFGGDFIYRFAMGRMRYWMGGEDALTMLELYKADGRNVWIQRVNLTETQTRDLSDFLWNNAAPENRYYNYNYYTDNCSTRIRDALDGAVGGEIRRQTQNRFSGRTYRSHTLAAMTENPLLYVCLDYVIGQPGDRDLSLWDEMYLPQLMQSHLREVTLGDSPLLLSEQTYHRSTRPEVPAAPPNWLKWILLTGCSIALLLLICERYATVSLMARIGRLTLLLAWLLLTTIAGLILTFFNLATEHSPTLSNENILQMAPFAAVCLLLAPWALRRRDGAPRHPRATRLAAAVSLVLLALSVVGLALKVLPAFYQDNWRIISLALPIHVVVAMIFVRAASGAAAKPKMEKA